jgi:hypothetical protein
VFVWRQVHERTGVKTLVLLDGSVAHQALLKFDPQETAAISLRGGQ